MTITYALTWCTYIGLAVSMSVTFTVYSVQCTVYSVQCTIQLHILYISVPNEQLDLCNDDFSLLHM